MDRCLMTCELDTLELHEWEPLLGSDAVGLQNHVVLALLTQTAVSELDPAGLRCEIGALECGVSTKETCCWALLAGCWLGCRRHGWLLFAFLFWFVGTVGFDEILVLGEAIGQPKSGADHANLGSLLGHLQDGVLGVPRGADVL